MSAVLKSSLFSDAVTRAKFDPIWFAENILNLRALKDEHTLETDPNDSWELDQWTRDLLDAVGDIVRKEYDIPTVINHKGINQISVRAMHGPGKTFGLACLMHWFGFCFKGKIPCTAPKMAQLKSRLWPEFRKIRNRAIPMYKSLMRTQGQSIYWIGEDGKWDMDHWAFMETAANPENLAGLHDKFMMILVDEASGVDESLWPVIEGAISTGKIVILVIISNPTKNTGTFADTHLKPIVSKDWFPIHIRLDDTRRVSRAWVERMENKYGKNSPVVKVRCYGEFAAEDENQLFSLEWLESSRLDERSKSGDGSLPRHRLSIDVADGGDNFTVITHAIHYESYIYLHRQHEYSFPGGKSTKMAYDEAIRLFNLYGMSNKNGDDIVVDSLGVGAGVCSFLSSAGYSVVRYLGGASSDNSNLYRCRRVQSYLVARNYFREGKIVIADKFVDQHEWDDVYAQLCSVRRKVGMERVEDLQTKEEMRNAGITSPDRADSIAMQFATQSPMTVDVDLKSTIMGNQLASAGYGL